MIQFSAIINRVYPIFTKVFAGLSILYSIASIALFIFGPKIIPTHMTVLGQVDGIGSHFILLLIPLILIFLIISTKESILHAFYHHDSGTRLFIKITYILLYTFILIIMAVYLVTVYQII